MKLKIWILLFILGVSLIPTSFSNAETCECFCESTSGSESVGDLSDENACRSSCGVGNYLGCYTKAEEKLTPSKNGLCYSQYECENDTTEVNGEEVASEWGGQESSCLEGEGYCYSAGNPVSLSVEIINPSDPDNPITKIDSLPEYINVMYNFLIPAASLLAIIMLMIGGLQYMLARGDSGKIGNAKTRIRNAVVGLILLLSAVSMAQFVDPDFVELGRLQLPKVRTITFIDPNSTCEVLMSAGIEVTPNDMGYLLCGHEGTVTSTGDVEQSTFKVGDTCPFVLCPERESCVASSKAESGFDCVRCSEADDEEVKVSASACNNLLLNLTKDIDIDEDEHFYCEFYGGLGLDDECVELVYPGGNLGSSVSLDCGRLAQDFGSSCRAYDEVWGTLWTGNELDDIQIINSSGDIEVPLLEVVCKPKDPCGFAPVGQYCVVVSELGRIDCVNSGYVDTPDDPVIQDKNGDEIDYGILL